MQRQPDALQPDDQNELQPAARLCVLERPQDVVVRARVGLHVGRQVLERVRGSSAADTCCRSGRRTSRSAASSSTESPRRSERAEATAARNATAMTTAATRASRGRGCGGALRRAVRLLCAAEVQSGADGSVACECGRYGNCPSPRRSSSSGSRCSSAAARPTVRSSGSAAARCSPILVLLATAACPAVGRPSCRSRCSPCGVRSPSPGRACLIARGTTRTAPSCTRCSPRSGLGSRAHAGARERARGAARRGDRVVAARQGLPVRLRLQRPGRHTSARTDRSLESAGARDDVRARARARRAGTRGALLAYASLVALVLTYSRGGVLTALLVCVAGSCSPMNAVESAATLVAAAVPAAVVGGLAFVLPGVTSDAQSLHTRWRDGIVFGVLLLAGASATSSLLDRAAVSARRACVASGARARRRRRRGAVVFVAVHGIGSGHRGERRRSIRLDELELPVHLVAPGVARLPARPARRRRRRLVPPAQPAVQDVVPRLHDRAAQPAAAGARRAGLVGLALLVSAARAAAPRSPQRSRACACVAPAGVPGPRARRRRLGLPRRRRACVPGGRSTRRAPAATPRLASRCAGGGRRLLVFGVPVLAVAARRWANEALVASPARAVTLANRAHDVDPLLVEPYWAKAGAATRGEPDAAFAAVRRRRRPAAEEPTDVAVRRRVREAEGCPYLA